MLLIQERTLHTLGWDLCFQRDFLFDLLKHLFTLPFIHCYIDLLSFQRGVLLDGFGLLMVDSRQC